MSENDSDNRSRDPLRVLNRFLEEDSSSMPEAEPTVPELTEAEKNARLVRLDGPAAGEEIRVDKEEVTIGRLPSSDIVLDTPGAEDTQATIERTSKAFVLHNRAEKTSSTFVDGVPVRDREIESHDIVEVAGARFEFLQGTDRSRAQKSVIERPPRTHGTGSRSTAGRSKRGRAAKPRIDLYDWRVLLVAGFLLGLMIVFFFPRHEPSAPVTPAPIETEVTRLVRHHLDKAAKLLAEGKLDEAEPHLDKVREKEPNNTEADALDAKLEKLREREKEETRRQEESERAKERDAAALVAEARKSIDAGKLDEARRILDRAETLDPDSRTVRASLARLDEEETAHRRDRLAQRRSDREIEELYRKGMIKAEAGELGVAEDLLAQVAARKGNKFQKDAQRTLTEIRAKSHQQLDDQITRTRLLIEGGELLPAFEEASALSRNFPRHDGAAKLLADVERAMAAKAKQLYTEGIAYQELVEDPTAAIQKYEEVLRYALNPRAEYHRKAKKKLEELRAKGSP